MIKTLRHFGGWAVGIPSLALTDAHLAIVRHDNKDASADAGRWADLVTAYRASRSALSTVHGCDGFAISFAIDWKPDGDSVGEPEPMTYATAIHVFGRSPNERYRPVRQMAVPTDRRQPVHSDTNAVDELRAAISHPEPVRVPGPRQAECDGCAVEVVRDQERWRQEEVRVIRPRYSVIDAQVMVLPLRHVVSLGDLVPREVASINARLRETLDQFAQSVGSTGLSCFANDGVRAGQHTPHVHLHVLGRSHFEPVNPFEALANRARP